MTVSSRDRGPTRARKDDDAHGAERHSEAPATLDPARLWIHQFARTLKTCRLYEPNNPTVARFLDDLSAALDGFHREHGALELTFTSDDVLHEGTSVYSARSRDDNLALPFYRDGVRALAFQPGTTRAELTALIACIVHVTTHAEGEGDLVTALWEAHLDHIDVDYVPAEGEVGAGDDLGDAEPMPWPETEEEPDEPAPESAAIESEGSRSDDWTMRERTTEAEAGFMELETLAPTEVKRFHHEYRDEHQVALSTTAIAIVQAFLASGIKPTDAAELERFVPRVLRESLEQGRWLESAEAVALLDRHARGAWSRDRFCQELLQPISVSQVASKLDVQDPEAVHDFTDFARTLGDIEIDVLVAVLAQSEYRRTRRMLSEAVVARCRENPERLAPWLADPRWPVVRNVVHMLGMIGGPAIVPLLGTVSRHAEPRVRYAVVASLGQAPPPAARPLLLEMVPEADSRTFCSVLQLLSREQDPDLARAMLDLVRADGFDRRPGPEKRAVYLALATTATDELVPELEAELLRGGWFALQPDEHRTAITRCLARIGTLESMRALERGAHSKRAAIRRACEEALMGWAPHE